DDGQGVKQERAEVVDAAAHAEAVRSLAIAQAAKGLVVADVRGDDDDCAGRDGAVRIHAAVAGSSILGFLALQDDGRVKFHEQQVAFVTFSTYDLGGRPAQSLCIRYTPPDRKQRRPQKLSALPPRGAKLLCHAVRLPNQVFRLVSSGQSAGQDMSEAPP